jgi:hypothetical protein
MYIYLLFNNWNGAFPLSCISLILFNCSRNKTKFGQKKRNKQNVYSFQKYTVYLFYLLSLIVCSFGEDSDIHWKLF